MSDAMGDKEGDFLSGNSELLGRI
ncbi:hypothetical protein FOBRF1_011639 [Fusarium oxysporum]